MKRDVLAYISHAHIYMEDAINILWRCWLVCTGCSTRATQNGFTLRPIHSLSSLPVQQKLMRPGVCAPYSQRLQLLPRLVFGIEVL